MTKSQISAELQNQIAALHQTIQNMDADQYFTRKNPEKWSIGENVEHLVLSVEPLNKLFLAPAFALRYFGKPNRPPRVFEEVKAKYYEKLGSGLAVAGTPFGPKIEATTDTTAALNRFSKSHATFIKRLNTYSEKQLDSYLIPHPLLGKLYVREMLYFTAFHVEHHHRIVRGMVK